MLVRKSIVGITEDIIFVKKPGIYKKGNVHYVGKIIPLTRIVGCSPVYKNGDDGLTALHCVARGCRLRGGVYDDNVPIGKTKRDITLNVNRGTKLSILEIDFDVKAYIDDIVFAKFVKSALPHTDTITFRGRGWKSHRYS